MKHIFYLALLLLGNNLLFCQNQFECGFEYPTQSTPAFGGVNNHCDPDPTLVDNGNFMYFPDANSPIHTIRVNVHVMQNTAASPDNFENTVAHRNHIDAIIANMNSEVFNNQGTQETCNSGNTTAPAMPDTRIRVQRGNIFFHVDPIGHTNNAPSNGNQVDNSFYCRDNYLTNNPIHDNSMNIFLVEFDQDGTDGWGPGFNNEADNHIVMNEVFTRFLTGTTPWVEGGTWAHELGHCLGLLHTWLNSQKGLFEYICCPDPPTPTMSNFGSMGNNHNMAYSGNMKYLSPLQVGHIRRLLLSTWRSKQIIEPTITVDDYVFNNDYTLMAGDIINWVGNIVVETGTELTIEGELVMHKDKHIIVERGARLFVDGGLITACDDQWQGIIVEGNNTTGGQPTNLTGALNPNSAGIVLLRNGAIIENAKTAISTDPTHLGSDQNFQGGLVDAEDSTIRNCNVGVEFVQHAVPDRSEFTNCTFQNLIDGAIIDKCNDILFETCLFENIADIGIEGIDSDIIVQNGCEFITMPIGIELRNLVTHPRSSLIGDITTTPNSFLTDDYGILAKGSFNNEELHIENNNISSFRCIKIEGASHFDVLNNEMFNSGLNLWLDDTGGFYTPNKVNENLFIQSANGSLVTDDNYSTRYADNCFVNIENYDINIFPNGFINLSQHCTNSSVGANNCFTKNGIPEIRNQGPNPIDYYVIASMLPNCETLNNSVGVTMKPTASIENQNVSCGTDDNLSLCDNNISLSGLNTQIYDQESTNWIRSRELILNNAGVDYDAVDVVELLTGFEVDQSSNFMAFMMVVILEVVV